MGLLKDDKLLKDIAKYLDNTDFTNKEIGHRLALSFLPTSVGDAVEDNRYTFEFRHKLMGFKSVDETYGGLLVRLVTHLNKELLSADNIKFKALYEDIGLIEDDRCTIELIATTIANGVAVNASVANGNKTNNMNKTDNLQLLFPEFNERNITYFLKQVDNYVPQS